MVVLKLVSWLNVMNTMVKSPYNWVIHTLTQPQVANQQKKKQCYLKSKFKFKGNFNFKTSKNILFGSKGS